MTDSLGDRMKAYERRETDRRVMPLLPIYARIDGRCFSGFTRGMRRPFDAQMHDAMKAATWHLVSETHARIGYTQSDEINLVWLYDTPETEPLFGGKLQKLSSVLAGMATAAFVRALYSFGRTDLIGKAPHFDARVFQLPNREEAANAILWREFDATKNAISMAARCHYSAKQLHGKTGDEMQEMLHKAGINFNDYPASFKRGTFLRRQVVQKHLSFEEIFRIPVQYRPPEGETVLRSEIQVIDMPPFGKVTNRVAVIFEGAKPRTSAPCG